MIRLISTALLSATLALSPVAPAQAQMQISNDELTRILLGVATIGAIGIAIDRAKDKKDRKKEKARQKRKAVETQRRAHDDHESWRKRSDRDFRDHRSSRFRALPARCERFVEGRRGIERRVLGKRCLERNTRAVRHLPQRCERTVHAYGRYRTVYGARCLEKFGWTVARHR